MSVRVICLLMRCPNLFKTWNVQSSRCRMRENQTEERNCTTREHTERLKVTSHKNRRNQRENWLMQTLMLLESQPNQIKVGTITMSQLSNEDLMGCLFSTTNLLLLLLWNKDSTFKPGRKKSHSRRHDVVVLRPYR